MKAETRIPAWASGLAVVVAATVAVISWTEARFVRSSEYAIHLRDFERLGATAGEQMKTSAALTLQVGILLDRLDRGWKPGAPSVAAPPESPTADPEPDDAPPPDTSETIERVERAIRRLRPPKHVRLWPWPDSDRQEAHRESE